MIRGGFAVNYDFFFNNILANTAATVPNSFGVTNFGASLPANTDPRGIAKFGAGSLPTTGTPDPFATINTIPTDLVNPQTYVYNFGIQRELPFKFIGDVAYVGSRGTRLFINEQLNPGIGGFDTLEQAVSESWLCASRAQTAAIQVTTLCKHDSIEVSVAGSCCGLLTRSRKRSTTWAVRCSPRLAAAASVRIHSIVARIAVWRRSMFHIDSWRRLFTTCRSLGRSGFVHNVLGGYSIAGTYRLQSGNVQSPFVVASI